MTPSAYVPLGVWGMRSAGVNTRVRLRRRLSGFAACLGLRPSASAVRCLGGRRSMWLLCASDGPNESGFCFGWAFRIDTVLFLFLGVLGQEGRSGAQNFVYD